MAKPQITITLGRTGQVVKKGGPSLENVRSDWRGKKRSMRERLGGDSDSIFFSASKRQHGDGMKWSPGNNGVNDFRIARNDLRLKLMRKGLSKRVYRVVEERKEIDLREKLPRIIRPPVSANMRQQRPEPVGSSLLRQIPPKESADDLLQLDSLRKSYTSRTLDRSRARSPYRNLNTSRGLSPPINFDEQRRTSSIRGTETSGVADALRARWFLSNDRLTGPTPITMKATSETTKPIIRLAPTTGIMQKSSHVGEEPLTVPSLLHSIGLGKYAILFQAEEVDMTALKQMGDKDLKELGIPMGPRKKILLALLPRSKRKPAQL